MKFKIIITLIINVISIYVMLLTYSYVNLEFGFNDSINYLLFEWWMEITIIILVVLVFILLVKIEKVNNRTKELLVRKSDLRVKVNSVKEELEQSYIANYLDIADVIFVVLDTEQRVKSINKRGCDFLGYNREEVIGKNWFDNFIKKEDRVGLKKIYSQVMDKDFSSLSENLILTKTTENILINKDGEERRILWHNALMIDEDGSSEGTVSLGTDITKQYLLEEELKSNKKELDAFVEVSYEVKKPLNLMLTALQSLDIGDLIFLVINNEGNAILINNRGSKILGYNKEDIVGNNIFDVLYRGEGRKKIKEKFNKVIDGKMKVRNYFESKVLTKDCKEKRVVWQVSILKSEEAEYEGLLAFGVDVTEQILLEEKLEYNKLKLEFLANMSHELKTPLNLIFSSLQILDLNNKNNLDDEKYKKVKGYTDIIRQNGYRLLRLTNNLIDITKINTNGFTLNLSDHDIVALLSKITESVKKYMDWKSRNIKFYSNIDKKVMTFDPFILERIILNLLSNAVKFTDEGDDIFVKLSSVSEEEVIIIVEDTGVGIAKEKQEIIFDRFTQIDKSFRRRSEGSGIGLSIVKLLVELHRGKIEVESEVGEGSRFIITLPVTTEKVDEENKKGYNISNLINNVSLEFSDVY
ncbi:sensor histidine kinase [Halonatronum saccharophilum]|uniref:sensor histidine kinase n=1 Tax=Halonatronum saccharophilum TaxID=150060 RepID=UPI00068793A6|nr:PAS domain-containing sensor histidine kinase [Halonatronum saccharophilum]